MNAMLCFSARAVGILRTFTPFSSSTAAVQRALSSIPSFAEEEGIEEESAAKRAYSDLVATILSQASQRSDDGAEASTSFQFEGLHMFDEQQSVSQQSRSASNYPSHIERSLAAIRYHQGLMDGTPKGRRLQRNWQRQITLVRFIHCHLGVALDGGAVANGNRWISY